MPTSIANANQRTDYFRAQIGELPFSDFKSFAIYLANVRRVYACHGKDEGRRSLDAFLDSLHLKDCKGATDAETFRALDDAYLSLSSQFDWHAGALNIYGADDSIVKSGQGRILAWLTGAVGIRHLDVFTITCGDVLTTLKDRAGTSESVRPVKAYEPPNELRGPGSASNLGAAPSAQSQTPFSPALQEVWDLLAHTALTAKELAAKVAGAPVSEDSIRKRIAAIRRFRRMIENRRGLGYYRPDAPPDGRTGTNVSPVELTTRGRTFNNP